MPGPRWASDDDDDTYGLLSRHNLLSIDRNLRNPVLARRREKVVEEHAPSSGSSSSGSPAARRSGSSSSGSPAARRRMLGPLSPSAIKRALSPAPRGAGDAAEQQRRLTEHLRRNLGLASLRVTISTEQRKQLEGALRTWTQLLRKLAYRRLKTMWLAETSVAFHRWLLLRRGVVGWCALMNAVHRERQRTALLRLQALGALLTWRQRLRAHNVRAALAQRGTAGRRHVALKRGLPIVWSRWHAEALLAAEMLLTAAKWHRLTGCAARLPRWRAKATATRAAAVRARTAAAAHTGAASADAPMPTVDLDVRTAIAAHRAAWCDFDSDQADEDGLLPIANAYPARRLWCTTEPAAWHLMDRDDFADYSSLPWSAWLPT